MTTQNPVQVGTELKQTPKDFASDQDVRWCPGCGDYSILAQIKKVMNMVVWNSNPIGSEP